MDYLDTFFAAYVQCMLHFATVAVRSPRLVGALVLTSHIAGFTVLGTSYLWVLLAFFIVGFIVGIRTFNHAH